MRAKRWVRRWMAAALLAVVSIAPAAAAEADPVPLRFLAEAAGATVAWEGESRTVTVVTEDGVTVTLRIGDTEALVDGQPVPVGAEPFLAGDRTWVPQSFMERILAMPVAWDPEKEQPVVNPYVLKAFRLVNDLKRGDLAAQIGRAHV